MRPSRWPTHAALAMIDLYQRCLSPHKGFRCAHAVQTGRRGCSALGARAIRRHGLWDGLGLLGCRFDACALSHQQLQAARHRPRLSAESGVCDFDCGVFDACDVADCACDALDCADCFDRKKRCSRSSSADAARERSAARQNRRKNREPAAPPSTPKFPGPFVSPPPAVPPEKP
ncbi:Haemolytic domain-containing protein [Rhizobacter sp. OV335]|nr:membrane protein insertion efficiency factor YidD [Rhizobacter sp. OV335]SHN34513.1 Haemolytic domain-containing protein [Rhizobacter sp. OV335]